MVTIISKSDGPRREDVAARKILEKDRATITRLADHLTQGAYSQSRQAAMQPAGVIEPPERQRLTPSEHPRPYVRISPNGRVVLMDLDSARQLALLGEVRRLDGRRRFVLATAANGFAAALENELAQALADLDGRETAHKAHETELKTLISQRIGLA